jgi:hypothetical protein
MRLDELVWVRAQNIDWVYAFIGEYEIAQRIRGVHHYAQPGNYAIWQGAFCIYEDLCPLMAQAIIYDLLGASDETQHQGTQADRAGS